MFQLVVKNKTRFQISFSLNNSQIFQKRPRKDEIRKWLTVYTNCQLSKVLLCTIKQMFPLWTLHEKLWGIDQQLSLYKLLGKIFMTLVQGSTLHTNFTCLQARVKLLCSSFSSPDGSELLVSYCADYVYLFTLRGSKQLRSTHDDDLEGGYSNGSNGHRNVPPLKLESSLN